MGGRLVGEGSLKEAAHLIRWVAANQGEIGVAKDDACKQDHCRLGEERGQIMEVREDGEGKNRSNMGSMRKQKERTMDAFVIGLSML